MPEFLLPFGPFHMVILHLPIGALAAIWFLEILLPDTAEKHKNPSIGLLHLFLLLTCALTIALGLSYQEFAQYGDEIEQHEFWGYIFGGCVVATYLFYWINRIIGRRGSKWLYMLSLLAATITMTITGHQGGELIHGKGFLAKPFKADKRGTPTPHPSAPASAEAMSEDTNMEAMDMMGSNTMMDSTPPVAPHAAPQASALSPLLRPRVQPSALSSAQVALFESSQAIFKRHCTKCHGATKQKGDYRLDSKHSINIGGKSQLAAIVPGNPDDSELMYRMLLPRDDDDVMPPEEKDPVSSQDIDTVRQWIEAGAFWPDEAALGNAPDEHVKTGDADTDQLIQQISTTGAKAEYNAWGDGSVRIDLGVVEPGQLTEALDQLSGFSAKLSWLDCSQLELPSNFFQQLTQFKQLERLHLDGSNVTDQQLQQLGQLPKLSYLNLYNTRISGSGLEALQSCENLKKIYLRQTQVTSGEITQLKSARPELEVIY